MKLFIDSADIKELEAAAATHLVDGCTTNPSLVAKDGGGKQNFEKLLRRICEIIPGPVSAEVTAMDYSGMMEQAEPLIQIHPHITIKLPLTFEGLKACKALSQRKVKTNVTLCFSAAQALLAAKAGATFISPFVGRLDDISAEGMKLIADIKTIYEQYEFSTQILVASVRHPDHVMQAALIGADVATIPYKVFQQLIKHPLTDSGLQQFIKDWENSAKA